MGYGRRAIELLRKYYEFKIPSVEEDTLVSEEIENVPDKELGLLEECIEPRKQLPPLLLKLSERPPEKLDYLGVSFGLTEQLLKFWKKSRFVPVYLRQTTNELTGEHSCIMLSILSSEEGRVDNEWLNAFWIDFRRRFLSLLSYQFKTFKPAMALGVLTNKGMKTKNRGM